MMHAPAWSPGDLASPSLRWSARGACELLCIAYTCPRRDGAGQITLVNYDLLLTSPLRFHSGPGDSFHFWDPLPLLELRFWKWTRKGLVQANVVKLGGDSQAFPISNLTCTILVWWCLSCSLSLDKRSPLTMDIIEEELNTLGHGWILFEWIWFSRRMDEFDSLDNCDPDSDLGEG